MKGEAKALRSIARSVEAGMVREGRKPDVLLAVLTGSQVYGKPKADSDIDLILLCSTEEYDKLLAKADKRPDKRWTKEIEYRNEDVCHSLRFGNLNLLVTWDPEFFDVWTEGTARLKAIRPVERAEAVAVFDELREREGYD